MISVNPPPLDQPSSDTSQLPDIPAQVQAKALIRGEVPHSWAATWPSAPEEPSLYLQGLAKRIVALKGAPRSARAHERDMSFRFSHVFGKPAVFQ